METIEAHHERRSKFDLTTDFTIRKVSEHYHFFREYSRQGSAGAEQVSTDLHIANMLIKG